MLNKFMTTITNQKKSKRGGFKEGAGRPVGTKNKLSAQSILDSLEQGLGKSFSEQLTDNYIQAIATGNRDLRLQYDKLFLSKVVADKVDVSVTNSEDVIAAKQQAFAEALKAMTGLDYEKPNND